ncbi:uncharacterized protein LOC127871084 isoform X2 [Dreissena polymorpha]|uniref:Macro domain-containing protein n=1 Tax=Dreissena polymorpha TaxID=45954 RepID=A0A9D4LCU4_DREPO|nr:uncharacterized protein LOC127871084 isoform X1 [Dreissena polymorpha]XP_052269698.1 uncharacterized protein LOC127871084 isoform X2 [Dreissena polymorpha]KAH3855760.1 hypothetical protein DPMN_098329 [Dreissena polymorpha]
MAEVIDDLFSSNVDERDVKYFEFLAKDKNIQNWKYDISTKTIKASPKDSFELEVFKEVIAIFERRVCKEITSSWLVSAVQIWFDDRERRSRFEFAHPVFSGNHGAKSKCTLFASNCDDLERLLDKLKPQWSPDIILPKFRFTPSRELYICTGDIVDFDEQDAGIVNPVVIRSSGNIEGRGKVFERLKEAGGQEYTAELNAVVRQDGSHCVTTRGGLLKSFMIHPLRKVINDDTKKDSFIENLKDCFMAAQEAKIRKLILPLVYSGSGGVPLEECAFFYACAIYEFWRESRDKFLGPETIYFVEHDRDKAESLVKMFKVLVPTLFTHHMVIPKEYDSVFLASHTYVNQPRVLQERVSDAYETVEQRENKRIETIKVENINAVPGRQSTKIRTYANEHSVHISADPLYDNIDSSSVCDIDAGPAPQALKFVSDSGQIPNEELEPRNASDYNVIQNTAIEREENINRSFSVDASDYEDIETNGSKMEKFSIKEPNSVALATGDIYHVYDNICPKQYQTKGLVSEAVVKRQPDAIEKNELTDTKAFTTKSASFGFNESKTVLSIYTADIREAKVDVIVCPEYQDVEFQGFVPIGIRCKFGIEQKAIEEKVFTKGRIATSRCPVGPESFAYVYHVKTSLFECGPYPLSTTSEKNLEQTVEKVFDKLHRLKRNIKTIAFPLIGSIDVADKGLVKSLCSHFVKVMFKCCEKRCGTNELEVQIVNHCATITEWLQESLHKHINGDYIYS